MLIIGCDFHPSGQQVFVMERESGEVVGERWLNHGGDEVDQFYASWSPGAEVGGGDEREHAVVRAQAGAVRAPLAHRRRGQDRGHGCTQQKHDRRSAQHIATLMCQGTFPDLRWRPTLSERDQRQLLLHRHKLVRMRAQVKNQLQHIAINQGQQKKQQLWTKKGRELLEKLELEPWTGRRRDDLLALLDTLEGHCATLDQAVERAAEENAAARLLKSHPGIGPVISLAFALTVGDISRFDRSRQVVSYLGLNPAEDSSGERRRLGSISKQGNSFMRLLLIQGAQTAVRGDAELGRQYRRLAARKNKAMAKVMVARKLAVRMFWILKTRRSYPEVVRMRGSSSHPGVETTAALSERPASPQA